MLSSVVILLFGVFAQQILADEPEAIVGGTLAALGEFPHQASLQYRNNHICGASIVRSRKAVTAAHCVYTIPGCNNLRILTATINHRSGNSNPVKECIIHPGYVDSVSASWNNDIAVLDLLYEIVFNSLQSPIPLATSPPVPGTRCTLSGWGRTSTNGALASSLLKLNTVVQDKNICERSIRASLTQSHLCVFAQYSQGACQGDSGGPLVCNGQLNGVTSFVIPCGMGYPDVFTDVYYQLGFLHKALAS